ncbi:MAG: ATP-binding protein [Chitinophagaceae bacterium]
MLKEMFTHLVSEHKKNNADRCELFFQEKKYEIEIIQLEEKNRTLFAIKEKEQQENKIYKETLFDLYTKSLRSYGGYDEAKKNIARVVSDTLACNMVSIWEFKEEGIACVYKCKDLETVSEDLYLFEKDFPEYFAELKKAIDVVINNVYESEFVGNLLQAYFIPNKIYSTMDIPIHLNGKLYGIICCEKTDSIKIWSDQEIYFSRVVADILSMLLEHHVLELTEKKLLKSQAFINDCNALVEIGAFELDWDTLEVCVSDFFKKIVELDEHEVMTLDMVKKLILNAEEYDRLNELATKYNEGYNRDFESTIPIQTFKKNERWLKVISHTEFEQGIKKRTYGSIQNITQQKHTEDRLRKVSKMEEIDKIKTSILANVTHELRTPLNGIIGMADILIGTNLDNVQTQYVQTISHSADSLLQIINNVLDFSKINSEIIPAIIEETNLKVFFDDIKTLLKYHVERKSLSFQMDIDKDFPSVILFEKVKIKQVLMNLLYNAVKFTQQGEIACSVKLLKEVGDNLYLLFEVSDTGKGIHPDYLETIFEPFTQEDISTTREYSGTGLGLSISNQLLKSIGSTLEVKSEVSKGSTFYFEIKAEKSISAEADAPPVVLEQKVVERLNESLPELIMIVEDNLVNMFLMKSILQVLSPQATILEAENGEVAVELYKKHQPQLIFMDLQMPVMSGFDATRSIRKLPHSEQVIIIAVTAGTTEGDEEKCKEAGMNDFVLKPIIKRTIEDLFFKWYKKVSSIQEPILKTEDKNVHVDYDKLENSLQHNHAFMKSFLPYVKESLEEGLKELYIHFFKHDMNNISIVAHRIKGTAVTACLPHLERKLSELENMKQFTEQEIGKLLSEIDMEIDVVLTDIIPKLKIG